MEKIVQLKDTSNQNISPITVAEAVLKEDTSIVSSLLPEPEKPNSILVSNGNTSQWKPINAIFQGQLELLAYGVRIDPSIADPKLERIGNMDLHRSLPIQNKMKRCLLLDDGTVNYYLDPNNSLLKEDGTPAVLDGTDGQVMVEIPRFYYLGIPNGSCTDMYITEYPLEGFIESRKQYVSAYQATVDRENTLLASVCSMAERYRGGNNNAAWDGTYRSLLGMPATNISLTNFRAYARNRGAAGLNGCGWNCHTYKAQRTIYWLFVIEYANRNCQAEFNPQPDSNGYHQGGLGAGVTNLNGDKWHTFNGYNPFIPCGYTDELGNGTGIKTYDMPTEYSENPVSVQVPRYRGIENPFGYIWQWTDGINVRISPTTENGGDGLSKVFVCEDPSKFKDNGYDGYSHVGNEARTGGYVKEIIGGEGGEIMPSLVGGDSTTYFCDQHYTNTPDTETLRGVMFGGSAYYGAGAGLACAHSNSTPSDTYVYIGSRLCFIPED